MATNNTYHDVVREHDTDDHSQLGIDENGEFTFNLNNRNYDLELPNFQKGEGDINPAVEHINRITSPHKNKLLFGHVNARSLPNSIHELSFIMDQTHFDCLGVGETWLTPGTPSDRVNIDGYKI